jgi:small-conductance mechanosensitive channel
MARRLRVLGLLGLFALVYYASLQVLHLPPDARLLARGIFISLFVLNLLWFVWLLGRLPVMVKASRRVRGLLAALLVVSLLAEWLGYRGLSTYLLRAVVGTAVLTSLAWALHIMLTEIVTGLARGKHGWQRRLRQLVGLSDGQTFPGLSTLRFLLVLGLWTGLVLVLMKLWGVPESLFQRLYLGFQGGFQLGGLYIMPSRIILALLIFALLLQVFSRFKEAMEKRWLPASRLDRGAREATVTVFGYAGFLVAVLVGLSAAGLDLTKLALIAGALSVGIGFGLQNVVNNFVSGLILLFERPISTGDFVSVGDTEGYVRRISIRSTEIETLDRRSVIVPNSDLISGRVINWMRNDAFGRVKVEVGVAYGSDLRQVSRILQEIATGHPDVVNNSQTQPSVFCTGFGDSAVNFAIYAVVGNFKQRFQVAHDMYLAIEGAFARHGIEIPFPQRVLHTAPARPPSHRRSAGIAAGELPPQRDPLNLPDPD